MRRFATMAGAVAATGLFILASATPAAAAEGTLRINGMDFPNPSGCINNPEPGHSYVQNETDAPIFVFTRPDCDGAVYDVVQPGDVHHVFTISVMPQW